MTKSSFPVDVHRYLNENVITDGIRVNSVLIFTEIDLLTCRIRRNHGRFRADRLGYVTCDVMIKTHGL